MRFCPFAHRAHLVLNAKNLPHHVFYINLSEKPEWYTGNVNPNGKVPALQLLSEPNEPIITESMNICEYLDDKYPDNKLFPTDALEKTQTKLLIESFSSVATAFYRLAFVVNPEDEHDKLINDLYTNLKLYEDELAKRGTEYFGGDKPNILDYGIWPWFERFPIVASVYDDKFKFDGSNFPKLVSRFNSTFCFV